MAYEEIVQPWASMQADIQEDSGKTLRLFTIHALFLLSTFTKPLHWNTVYLERAVNAMGSSVNDELLQCLSPLGWEHINLTGDYVWQQNRKIKPGQFRDLRSFPGA